MNSLDLEFYFESSKRRILDKIQKSKENWQKAWEMAQGIPAMENRLLHLKLENQLLEIEALKELGKLEEKVKRATEDDLAPG